ASLAVGRIKRAVQSGAEMALEQGLALERELQAELFASEDAREGLAAYVEKRAPAFKGRWRPARPSTTAAGQAIFSPPGGGSSCPRPRCIRSKSSGPFTSASTR